MTTEQKQELVVIRSREDLERLPEYLDQFDFLAFDTETTGVEKDSEIIGFSVCGDVEVGIYVVLSEWLLEEKEVEEVVLEKHVHPVYDPMTGDVLHTTTEEVPVTVKVMKQVGHMEYLETSNKQAVIDFMNWLKTKQLVMHNAVFDCAMVFNNYGVQLMDALHTDTMILAHLVDENRKVGLKELGFELFGENAYKEQAIMKKSIAERGGECTRAKYELYKADPELIAHYGAKDAVLTLQVFYAFVPELFEQGLDKFFYEDESMPLLKEVTYDLNTVGLKVDAEKIKGIQHDLEIQILKEKAFVHEAIQPYIKDLYPGTSKKTTFNINSNEQLAWLLFIRLNNEFRKLTKKGRDTCKEHEIKPPYSPAAKRRWIEWAKEHGLKPQKLIACDKAALTTLAIKYEWVAALLRYKQAEKILKTYVLGIQDRMRYSVIQPSFLQHGTTSGRYSSKAPNFQNLPRTDKRVKSCIIARPGKVFVGADYSQLEPRVFASVSGDEKLCKSFANKEDFYSVIGIPVFKKYECVPLKDGHPKAFGKKHPVLRDIAKGVALSATYGTTAYKLSTMLRDEEGNNLPIETTQQIIDDYFINYPKVEIMMLESHEIVKRDGVVYNLFGRPRRIPGAKIIKSFGKHVKHSDLPYEYRNLLNLSVNHRIQSTAASIMNRAAIAFKKACNALGLNVKIVMQVHDELICECAEQDAETVKQLMKDAMENTVKLPGVDLVAEPVVAKILADLK